MECWSCSCNWIEAVRRFLPGKNKFIQFQTHLRESVALWFIWFIILFYWLIYLCTDSTTKSIYNKEKFNDNTITCWSLYSITQLAHE